MNCTPLLSNVVKCKHSSTFNFRKIANRGNKKNCIILFVRKAQKSYLRMNTQRVGKHFKKCV